MRWWWWRHVGTLFAFRELIDAFTEDGRSAPSTIVEYYYGTIVYHVVVKST